MDEDRQILRDGQVEECPEFDLLVKAKVGVDQFLLIANLVNPLEKGRT